MGFFLIGKVKVRRNPYGWKYKKDWGILSKAHPGVNGQFLMGEADIKKRPRDLLTCSTFRRVS